MKIYNTNTKQVEKLETTEENVVKIYTCGPTVYNYAHIGNLRTYIFEDVLEKALKFLGYDVKRVMNITDVGHLTDDSDTGEDKMAKAAKEQRKSVMEIAEYYTEAFYKDIDKLNIRKPDIIAKASDHIEDYIVMIEKLIEKGYAYQSNGNVYFDVSKVDNYYQLSGKNKEDLIVGARDDVDFDASKKHPLDFGLWFTKSKFQDQILKWDSPFGEGYPGWHIECSAIALKYLGEKLDIHCGGVDNIFPHHTNEVAQSEAYLGKGWCTYWMHAEHLNMGSVKMSKSDGTFITVSTLEEKGYNPLAYRFFCLQSHYRKQLAFSYESLDVAANSYKKLKKKVKSLKKELMDITSSIISEEAFPKNYNEYKERFKDTLKDDLNTANSITIIYDILKEDFDDYFKRNLIEMIDDVLSLGLFEPDGELDMEIESVISYMIDKREQYKKEKNFEEADKIRDELKEMGVTLKDTKDGTVYEI